MKYAEIISKLERGQSVHVMHSSSSDNVYFFSDGVAGPTERQLAKLLSRAILTPAQDGLFADSPQTYIMQHATKKEN